MTCESATADLPRWYAASTSADRLPPPRSPHFLIPSLYGSAAEALTRVSYLPGQAGNARTFVPIFVLAEKRFLLIAVTSATTHSRRFLPLRDHPYARSVRGRVA